MSLFDDFSDDEDDDDSDIDVAEAADAQEIFIAPRAMTFSFGHEENEQALLNLFERGRMPQALVFSGPAGIGKSTMAFRFARFLLKQPTGDDGQDSLFGAPAEKIPATSLEISPEDPVFKRVASGAHPDLLVIERDFDETKNRFKDSVSVESARKVAPFLRMTASDGGWRIVIIDDADTMNRNAQNALLKILEEPPPNAVLILIAHRSGALIPTIHSRSQFLNFAPLETGTLLEALRRQHPSLSADQVAFLSSFSQGSLGRALSSLEQDVFGVFESIMEIWAGWPEWDWLKLYALADELAGQGKESRFEMFQKLMLWIIGSFIHARARGQGRGYDLAAKPAFRDFFTESPLEELLKICENLESHFNKVNFANLDKKQGVSGAFSLIKA